MLKRIKLEESLQNKQKGGMTMSLKYISILMLSILIVACQQNENSQATNDDGQNNRMIQVKNSDPIEREELSNQEVADRLANIADRLPDVDRATAIVVGPYTVVGIEVDKDFDRTKVGSIKYTVAETVHEDPYGRDAVVLADPDVVERIEHMGDKMSQGHPVQGIIDELSALIGRVMPEVPVPNDQPKEPNQNKESLPEDQQNKLDKIQEDQSNQQMD